MTNTAALPPLTKDLADAFIASATLWLARLLTLLLHPRAVVRERRFLRLVQFGERWVEYVLFVAAAQRLGVVTGKRRRANHTVVARPGFRIATGSNRLLWKSARVKLKSRDLIARATHLISELINPARAIAHYIKRIARGLCFRRLIACAPRAVAFASTGARDVAIADSS